MTLDEALVLLDPGMRVEVCGPANHHRGLGGRVLVVDRIAFGFIVAGRGEPGGPWSFLPVEVERVPRERATEPEKLASP